MQSLPKFLFTGKYRADIFKGALFLIEMRLPCGVSLRYVRAQSTGRPSYCKQENECCESPAEIYTKIRISVGSRFTEASVERRTQLLPKQKTSEKKKSAWTTASLLFLTRYSLAVLRQPLKISRHTPCREDLPPLASADLYH